MYRDDERQLHSNTRQGRGDKVICLECSQTSGQRCTHAIMPSKWRVLTGIRPQFYQRTTCLEFKDWVLLTFVRHDREAIGSWAALLATPPNEHSSSHLRHDSISLHRKNIAFRPFLRFLNLFTLDYLLLRRTFVLYRIAKQFLSFVPRHDLGTKKLFWMTFQKYGFNSKPPFE